MRAWLFSSCLLMLGTATTVAAAEPVVAPAVDAAAIDRSQEIICRKEKETGSLVKTKKTCHSRAQWAYIDDVNQAQTRGMQDDMRTRSGGN